MVLPFVDEDKPKCFLCHELFEDIKELQKHQKTAHGDFFEFHENNEKREPTPGDVSIF
jgi:quinol monooxygenase YgiN|tara:strand:- start:17 stop:190 length:174 start_codon:yes stop_codon:yes gene_type:complete